MLIGVLDRMESVMKMRKKSMVNVNRLRSVSTGKPSTKESALRSTTIKSVRTDM